MVRGIKQQAEQGDCGILDRRSFKLRATDIVERS
jgi:hypothetical protein